MDDRAQKISLLDVSSSHASEVPVEGNPSDVLRLLFDPSGDFLVYVKKSEIIVWSVRNNLEISRIPLPEGHSTRELAVSRGGRYVAASDPSGEARLWDTSSPDHAGTALLFDDEQSMSFSPDGRWLSIGGQNEIRLWDINEKKVDHRRVPVGGFLVKFSSDGSLLAAQESQYGKISVWDVRDVLLVGGTAEFDFKSVVFTSDNSRLAVSDGGVFVDPFDASWALRRVCGFVKRNLTREEWNKYLSGSDYIATCLP